MNRRIRCKMNGQMRNKARLLAHASTVALLAAAGNFGVVAEAQAACLNITTPTTISTDQDCAEVTTTVSGNVVNNANVGPPAGGGPGFFVGGEGSITGELLNNDTISGGDDETNGALTIAGGGNIAGGIRNTGQIDSANGNGISLGSGTTDSYSSAAMTGSITNSGGIHGGANGVAALFGTMSGGLTNNSNGVITGGDAAVYIASTFTRWDGGINNFGNIAGDTAGIRVGDLTGTGVGDVDFFGDIQNYGTISSLNGPSVIAGGNSFNGGIYNNGGVITQRDAGAAGGEGTYAGVGIVVSAETFNGPIQNSGQILGRGGPAIWVTYENNSFNGDIYNVNLIQSDGSDGTAVLIQSGTFNGSVFNEASGNIIGAQSGVAIRPDEFYGNVENAGTIYGNNGGGLIISSDIIDGSEGFGGVAAEIVNRKPSVFIPPWLKWQKKHWKVQA